MSISLLCALFVFSFFSTANATHKPVWEAGLVAGVFSLPKYSGSDERYTVPMALPYFIYRGDYLKADRRGIRGTLKLSDRSTVDLGFSYNLPVNNDTNDARKGMEDIPLIAQIGPRLNYRLTDKESQYQLLVRFPARSAWGYRKGFAGWILQPNLLASYSSNDDLFKSYVILGLSYRSIEHNTLFYNVPSQYENSSRRSYTAKAGLHSIYATLFSIKYFTKKIGAGAFAKWRNMSIGMVDDSPLVRQTDDYSGGFLFIWTFWESEERRGGNNHLNHADEDVI